MKNFLMASVIGSLLTVGALAQEPRDKRQQGRIKEGVESGELTNKEAKKLEDRERRTEQKEAKDWLTAVMISVHSITSHPEI